MDPHPITISDTKSNNSNKRLHKVLKSALDINIKDEAILSSTNFEKLELELEMECVSAIKFTSKDFTIPHVP